MNVFKKFDKAENYFLEINKHRKLGFAALIITLFFILLSMYPSFRETLVFRPLLVLAITSGICSFLWLISFFMPTLLRWMRRRYYRKLLSKPTKTLTKSESRWLTKTRKTLAWKNLVELRNSSDFCFLRGSDSYLRIQWLDDDSAPDPNALDVLRPWFKDRWAAKKKGEFILIVERKKEGKRERVFASWMPDENTYRHKDRAQIIELSKDIPVAFCLGTIHAFEDGTEIPNEQPICAITWMGGIQ